MEGVIFYFQWHFSARLNAILGGWTELDPTQSVTKQSLSTRSSSNYGAWEGKLLEIRRFRRGRLQTS